MANIPNRSNWLFNIAADSMKEVLSLDSLVNNYITDTLILTNSMFTYDNLPPTLPASELELMLQTSGYVVVAAVDGDLYCFKGGLGGDPNAYDLPTEIVVSNPYLRFNKTIKLDEDGVLIKNDNMWRGLLPIIKQYAMLLAEVDISFKFAAINSRAPQILVAPNDITARDANEYLKRLVEGKDLGVITNTAFEDVIKSINYNGSGGAAITQLIELKQYLQGTFYQKIGIQSQFNMKREYNNETESTMNNYILYPLIDNMLNERKEAIEKINQKYGTNIHVELNSSWSMVRDEDDLFIDRMKAEIDAIKEDGQESGFEEVKDGDSDAN